MAKEVTTAPAICSARARSRDGSFGGGQVAGDSSSPPFSKMVLRRWKRACVASTRPCWFSPARAAIPRTALVPTSNGVQDAGRGSVASNDLYNSRLCRRGRTAQSQQGQGQGWAASSLRKTSCAALSASPSRRASRHSRSRRVSNVAQHSMTRPFSESRTDAKPAKKLWKARKVRNPSLAVQNPKS